MFCPECGAEIRDDAAFCGKCGTRIGDSGPSANPAESAPEESIESDRSVKDDGRVLKDEVRYAPHLKEPVTDIPESKPTGNALGDELTRFANIYEASIQNYISLLEISQAKSGLEKAGYQWYYDHAKDPVIEASRQINAEIESTEELLKATRAQIAQNEQARLRAAQARDNEKSRNQRSADRTAKWSDRKGGCLLAIVIFFGVGALGMIGVGFQAENPGTSFVGILTVAACIALLVWYNKKSKSKVQNAQKNADAMSRTADARFAQTMQELAQKDADLSAQCIQIENKISELTPIAGEIRHQANERAKFLYSVEMLEIDELLKRVATAAISQTNTLREMGTIRNEDEWFEARHLAKIVTSGRADTMKEALEVLDTANYRDADLKVKGQMVEAQKMANVILAVGFTEMIANQQETIATMVAGFDNVVSTMEVNHAQEVALQMKQINQNAKIIKQQVEGNQIMTNGFQDVGQAVQAGNKENKDFHEEVRDRFNWTEQNRP